MKEDNKIYTELAVFLVIAVALIVFLILPLFASIKKDSSDLISAKDSMAALDGQIAETAAFQKNYESYKPNLEKITGAFIDLNNPVDLIKFLESTASESQITSKISLASSSNFPQAKQGFATFQFSSRGSFLAVLDFLNKIESGPYLIEIEDLSIQNAEDDKIVVKGPSLKKVNAVFTIKVFVKK